MIRNTILAAVLALSAGAALADNWVFDDPYWTKQPDTVRTPPATPADPIRGKYDHVDGYTS
jgi:hypothetical protein